MNVLHKVTSKIKNKIQNYKGINGATRVFEDSEIRNSIISKNVIINKNCIINKSGLGDDTIIGSGSMLEHAFFSGAITCLNNCKFYHTNIVGSVAIGKYTSLWGPNLDINCSHAFPVSIGNFCSIAKNVTMQSYNHNFNKITSYNIGLNFFKEIWENEKIGKGGIVIKNDVWIGTHCVILGGATIGNGVVIAANSVVNKDIPDYAIVAGSPAKIIGYRFESKIIEKLLKMEWWNWSDEKINQNKFLFENEINLSMLKKL